MIQTIIFDFFKQSSSEYLSKFFNSSKRCPNIVDPNTKLTCNEQNMKCDLCWRNFIFNEFLDNKKLTLKDIILKYSFEEIWEEIIKNYPESDEESYKHTWKNLMSLDSEETDCFLLVDHYIDDLDPEQIEEYDSVHGSYFAEQDITYGLMYVDWKKWLGMRVDNFSILSYGEKTFIAHCLWEMTFLGFDSREIDIAREELDNINYDESQFMPIDELFKEMEKDEE